MFIFSSDEPNNSYANFLLMTNRKQADGIRPIYLKPYTKKISNFLVNYTNDVQLISTH